MAYDSVFILDVFVTKGKRLNSKVKLFASREYDSQEKALLYRDVILALHPECKVRVFQQLSLF